MVHEAQCLFWVGQFPLVVSNVGVLLSECLHSLLLFFQVLFVFINWKQSSLVTLYQEKHEIMQTFSHHTFVQWFAHDQSILINHSVHLLTCKSSKSHGCHSKLVWRKANAADDVLKYNDNHTDCRAHDDVSLTFCNDVCHELNLLVKKVNLVPRYTVIQSPQVVLERSMLVLLTKHILTHSQHQLLLIDGMAGADVFWVDNWNQELFVLFIGLVLPFNHSNLFLLHFHVCVQEYSLVLKFLERALLLHLTFISFFFLFLLWWVLKHFFQLFVGFVLCRSFTGKHRVKAFVDFLKFMRKFRQIY